MNRLEPILITEIPAPIFGRPGSWGWGTRRHVNTVQKILDRCEKVGDCLVWPGSMTGKFSTRSGMQPQGSVAGDKGLHLRRKVWRYAGLNITNREHPIMLCGEIRCLNVEHMATSQEGYYTKQGKLTNEQRAKIKHLFIEGLEHKAAWQARQPIRLATQFHVTRERIRQVLAIELGVPLKMLGQLAAAWVEGKEIAIPRDEGQITETG